ncbi:hypothetical protein BBJ28_00004843 [Nothophytophthora sp. Chile5]|nr:hypothetical protein BBJ28_00004843 [Nothophytophthora sp. Chile5]
MLSMGRPAAGGSGSGEFSIAFVNGPIKFQSEEGVLYSRFFHIVRGRSFASRLGIRNSDEYICGAEGAAFIRRARLLNDANREIWRLASGGKSQEKLNKDCWFVAMKLVALVQSTGKCQMQSLYSGETLPLADFQLDQPVDNVLPEEALPEFKRSFVVSNEVCSHEKLSQTLELQIVLTASTEVRVEAGSSSICRGMKTTWFTEERQLSWICLCNWYWQGLIAGKELLKVASVAAAYVPTAASVTSLWGSLRDGVFLSSKNVQQVEIKTDDDYAKIGQHIDEYEKRIHEVTRCSDVVYAAQRSEGYDMSRFGSYLSALSEHEKKDNDMKRLAEAEDRMNQAKEQVQFIANSLKVESKRMDSGKTANFKTALLSLANLELDYQVQVRLL